MAVEWRLEASRYGKLLFATSFCAVLAALWRLELEQAWQGAVLLGAVLFYLRDWRDLFQPAVAAMRFGAGQWVLTMPDGRHPATIEQSHFLSQRIGVIRFRTADGCRRNIVFLPDSLSGEGFRCLAIALRRGGSAVTG